MVTPKYNFYCGKAINFSLTYNTYIDANGEYKPTDDVTLNAAASHRVKLDDDVKAIYVNYSPSTDWFDKYNNIRVEYLHVFMYDKKGVYLGKSTIDKAKLLTLKEGTAYVAIEFDGYTDDVMAMHKRIVKKDFADIYDTHTINPHYSSLAKKYSKESNQEFFRVSLDGKINLFGWDYEYVQQASLEDTMLFLVEKLDTTTKEWYVYYAGSFNKADCSFDKSKRSVELKLSVLDAYGAVLDGYDNKYDLIKLAPAISKIKMHKQPVRQIYIKGGNTITNIFGGTYWEAEVNEAVDDQNLLINKYYFAYIGSATEFKVESLPDTDANGHYAGINNSDHHTYTTFTNANGKGWTCKAVPAFSGSVWVGTAFDICNPAGTVKYSCTVLRDYPIEGDNFLPISGSGKYPIIYAINNFVYQRLLCDVDQIPNGPATYPIPFDDFVGDNRNYKRCIGQEGGNLVNSTDSTTEPTRFGENDDGRYFTNAFSPSYYRPIPVCRSRWANAALWYIYDLNWGIAVERLTTTYTLKDSFSLAGVIKALLSKISPTLMHDATADYSQFFYADRLPGAFVNDKRFYVYITQKTNILKGNYDQAAQKAEIAFKDLMEMLRDCFRCYWYIEGNKFKIEHISFFNRGGSYDAAQSIQLNFNSLIDRLNKKNTDYFQSAIGYNKNDLAARYEFEWMDDATENFSGPDVDVKSNYVQKDKTESINVSQFSSDVDFMLINPENFSDDGFALLCPVKNANNELELTMVNTTLFDSDDFTFNTYTQNFYASWKYLLRYYMWDMPAENIEINEGIKYTVRALKKSMTHDIELPVAEDLDAQKLIVTKIGRGSIDSLNISLTTRKAKVTLLYVPS